MKLIALLCILFPQLVLQQSAPTRVPLLREGTKIIERDGFLLQQGERDPIVVELPREDDLTTDSFVLLPNQRLAEMESAEGAFKGLTFRISGDVYAYGDQNYLLVREAVSIGAHASRNHPTSVPVDPNTEVLETEAFDDSIADIVDDLEAATGSLARSIRNASDNPIDGSTIKDGGRISSRRCHLVRNDSGAWVAVFVSDSTGLSDPPCTLLPSDSFAKLVRWASKQNPSTPVLLSGEVFNYHGHGFLLVRTWRPVHQTDHLD